MTLLGGTISSPDIATAHLIPAGDAVLGPGAGGTLRARTSFTCRGGARKAAGAPFAEVSTATVANISIRTEDGRQHNVRIVVQQFNPYIEIAECGFVVLPDGQVLSGQQVGLGPSLGIQRDPNNLDSPAAGENEDGGTVENDDAAYKITTTVLLATALTGESSSKTDP